jgi:signal transduction histidine kinase
LRRLGLRREVVILLPAATLVLLGLAAFTAVAFRGAVDLLVLERQGAAARVAHALAIEMAKSPTTTLRDLRPLALQAPGIALLAEDGALLAQIGSLSSGEKESLLLPLPPPTAPVGLGPDARFPDAVVGFAPFGPASARRYVRVDLPASTLAAQRRGARRLGWVVVGTGGAIVLVVLLFLRHLLAPYEALLSRARQAGDVPEEDEAAFLVATFERALAALARPAAGTDDDIAALERTLARSLESGLLLLDRDGAVLALNPAGRELLAIPAPASGTALRPALAAHRPLADLLAETVSHGQGFQRRECAIERDGERRTLGLTAHPLRRDDGGVRGYLVLFADLTDIQRSEAEQRLAESLARLGELAAGVAHELRNSLATLRGYLTLIERRPDEESVADYLHEIRRETDQLQRVLEDFLAFARPGSARLETVDVAALVRRAAADPALAEAPVEVRGAVEGLRLRGDPQLLERALRNLIHNAVVAHREAAAAGAVEVTVRSLRSGVAIEVADRGPGVPPELGERLFHPFAAGRAGGVGLGLALSQRIAQLHGGRLGLEDRPGGGTRALLELPAEAPAEAPPT